MAVTPKSPNLVAGFSSSLPHVPTSFVGRDEQLVHVSSLLAEDRARLVTLTGPSGVGKTRLAIEIAIRTADQFSAGVLFVDLTTTRTTGELPSLILRSAGRAGVNPDRQLIEICALAAEGELLLVLDNFEHLLEGADIVSQLLNRCPNLQVLITSQSLLRLKAEHGVIVEPLPFATEPGDLLHSPAASLFIDRATGVDADFSTNDANTAAIAQICTRLDGLPLALELAASRSNALTPQAILARLRGGSLDLSGSTVDVEPRHRRLRSAIAWSYSLLDDREKAVFRQLARCTGGFTLDAAEAVVSVQDSPDIFDTVSSLTDKSLIRHLAAAGESGRYSMLSAIREFGLEQLEATGELASVASRFALYFLRLAEENEDHLTGPNQSEILNRLSIEIPNFQSALRWALQQEDSTLSLRLASSLWRFWSMHGDLQEGRRQLEAALAVAGPSDLELRAKSWHLLGNMALDLGDFPGAHDAYQTGYDLIYKTDDTSAIARSLNGLGLVHYFLGAYDEAQRCHEQSLELRRSLGESDGIGNSLTNLGDVFIAVGDLDSARQHHEEALHIRRTLNNPNSIGYSLFNLGIVAEREGHYERAQLLMEEARDHQNQAGDLLGMGYVHAGIGQVCRELGDITSAAEFFSTSLELRLSVGDRRGLIECIEGVSALAASLERHEDAARLLGSAQAARNQLHAPLPPAETSTQEDWLRKIAESLGEEATEDHRYAGSLLDLAQASQEALDLTRHFATARTETTPAEPITTPHITVLTPREIEVLRLSATGMTDRDIANQLFMSPRTATTHQTNIRKKLKVQNRAEAVAMAIRDGLI